MTTTEAPPDAQTTKLQSEIVAKTQAAVKDTGFDAGFDAEVQAALDRDAAVTAKKDTPAPKVEVKVEPKVEPKAEPKAEVTLDIPEALLGEKKPEAKDTKADDEARQKEIEEATEGMSPRASKRFKALEEKKHAAEQRAAKAAELERKLAEAEQRIASLSSNPEAEAMKKQLEELDAIVQRTALTEHPRFRNAFDAKIQALAAEASGLVPKEAKAEVEALMSLPETAQRNRRLNEIASELEGLEQTKFHTAVTQADRLAAERAQELSNWKANKARMQELSAAEQKQTTEQRQRLTDSAYKNVVERFTHPEKGVELFRKVDGNDEWNRGVEARLENVKKVLQADLRPDDVAEMAAWAMSGNEYRKMFLSQRVLVKKLQAEIASLKAGEPSLGDAGGATDGDDENGSMVDVIARQAQRVGAVR